MKRRVASILFISVFLNVCIIPGIFDERSGWISLRNRLLSNAFQTSGTDQVIVGKDGWLYYGETEGHFTGENRLTESELAGVLDYLEALHTYYESKGIQFVFVCAPNKNTVYPEYMPENYLQAPGSDADKICDGLAQRGIAAPDLQEVFAGENDQLYHKLDSHWNNLGAALAVENIFAQVGRDISYTHLASSVRYDFDGDLSAMLYPDGLTKKDRQVYYNYDFAFQYTSRMRTLMDMEITTQCDGASGSLFMVRDSFGSSMIPFLAEGYEKCHFTRQQMSLVLEQTEGYDVVILEIAERNLRNLLKEDLP